MRGLDVLGATDTETYDTKVDDVPVHMTMHQARAQYPNPWMLALSITSLAIAVYGLVQGQKMFALISRRL